jgi:murein DD-endopeptidase MepM/ murein hydrolase activator NlpD
VNHRTVPWLIALLILPFIIQNVGLSGVQAQNPAPAATLTPDQGPQPTVQVVATAMPTPSPAPRTSGDPLVHLVAVGESLASLAAQSGFLVTDLAQRNNLTQPYLLLAGQKVRLPAPVSEHIRLHRVAAGETLTNLAAQYGISPYLLRETNKLSCGDCLIVGQLLRIPQSSVTTNLPEPFNTIDIYPPAPHQGDVVSVRVTPSAHLDTIVGTLAGRTLHFVEQEGTYVALTGIGALQDPGVYSVTLQAIASTGASSQVSGRIQVAAGGFGFENLTVIQSLVPLLDPQLNLDEVQTLESIESQWTPNQYWQGPFKLPVAASRIASYYGTRRSFNGGILRTYHSGTDLVAPVGTPIFAPAGGRVAAVQPLKVRGNVVIIDHGRGVFTVYCHLSSWQVSVGQLVEAGQLIAHSGNTGRSEGPHLHWELAVGGVTVDVLPWTQQAIP